MKHLSLHFSSVLTDRLSLSALPQHLHPSIITDLTVPGLCPQRPAFPGHRVARPYFLPFTCAPGVLGTASHECLTWCRFPPLFLSYAGCWGVISTANTSQQSANVSASQMDNPTRSIRQELGKKWGSVSCQVEPHEIAVFLGKQQQTNKHQWNIDNFRWHRGV